MFRHRNQKSTHNQEKQQKGEGPNQTQLSLDRSDKVAISYYITDLNAKVWICSPYTDDFVIEEPYTGRDWLSTYQMESWEYTKLFKIPPLRIVSTSKLTKNNVLTCVLWLKDHQTYTDQLVKSGHEFYRCISKEKPDWILIPLYVSKGTKSLRNPVVTFTFKNTIMIAHLDIFINLKDMFGPMINDFFALINNEKRWMIQFPTKPACFL